MQNGSELGLFLSMLLCPIDPGNASTKFGVLISKTNALTHRHYFYINLFFTRKKHIFVIDLSISSCYNA